MEEVEILVEVKDNLEKALSILKEYGERKTIVVSDTYFFNNSHKELAMDINGKMSGCLRIRAKAGKSILTYKKDFFEGNIWSHSDEYEVEIDNSEKAKIILEKLGFKELATLNIKKHIFYHNEYEIVLEEVDNLGIFLEVEYKGEVKDIKETKNSIRNFIKSLKIKTSEELNSGKLELYLKKNKINP